MRGIPGTITSYPKSRQESARLIWHHLNEFMPSLGDVVCLKEKNGIWHMAKVHGDRYDVTTWEFLTNRKHRPERLTHWALVK